MFRRHHVRNGSFRALLVNLGYAIILAAVSLAATPPRLPVLSRTDWLAHGLAYGIQFLLLHELFKRRVGPRTAVAAAMGVACLFGAIVETLQLLQPTRFFETSDLAANAVGISVAAILMVAVGSVRGGHRSERAS